MNPFRSHRQPPSTGEKPSIQVSPSQTSSNRTSAAPIASPQPPPYTEEGKATAQQYDTHDAHPFVPPLPYSIHTNNRVRTICFTFALCFLEAGLLPLILFYALKWGAHLSITINLAIITSVIGTFSGYRFSIRLWWLWFSKEGHERRVIGSGRWGVDTFQIIASIGMAAFFIPLIIGSSVTPASPHITSLALPLLALVFCIPLLLTSLLPHKIRVPFRMSSLPPMAPLPPFAFTLIEDVVAVDGGGGTSFRRAWAERYQASYLMRKLIRDVSFGWGITGTVFGGVWTGIVIPDFVADDVAVGIGYGLPWGWALVMTAWTVWYSKRMIAREYLEWTPAPLTSTDPTHKRPTAHRDMSLHVVERVIGSGPSARPPMGLPMHSHDEERTTLPMTGAHAQNVIGAEKGGPFSSHQGGPINSSKSVPTTHSPSSNTGSSGSGSGSGVGMGRMKSAPVQAESPIQGLPMPPASPTSITRPTAAMRKTSSHKRMAIGKNKSDRHERLESEDEA